MEITPGISVVVPVYNSQETLPALVERLQPVLASLTDSYELVMVNDGSRDNSWAVVESLAAQHGWITGINLMRNFGQHNALLCGIRQAAYALIVTMDDDLQNPPEEIPKMLAKLDEGYDVIYGTPAAMQHGLLRNMASQVTKLVMQSTMGVNAATHISAFRVFRTHLRGAFANYTGTYVSIDVLLTWGTTRFAAVTVRHDPRTLGVSNYTLGKLLRHALNMITGFSVMPLRMASVSGFAFTAFGILVFLYVVGRYLIQGGSVPGFPFLASIIAIFSGVQLFTLGIIGEYLARIHVRAQERPAYTVLEKTSQAQPETHQP